MVGQVRDDGVTGRRSFHRRAWGDDKGGAIHRQRARGPRRAA